MNENLTNQIVTSLLQDGSVAMSAADLAGLVAPVVAGLAKQYAFKGVVRPNNSPGSINVPTAVVACTGGTYRGYSSIVLDQFTAALFVSDDGAEWEAKEIYNLLAKAVDEAVAGETETEAPETGLLPRVLYNLGLLESEVNLALAESEDGINHYYLAFDTGATPPTIDWPTEVKAWENDEAPTLAANKHYEVSILDGVGAWLECSLQEVEPGEPSF